LFCHLGYDIFLVSVIPLFENTHCSVVGILFHRVRQVVSSVL
jgi:hypothetical protein